MTLLSAALAGACTEEPASAGRAAPGAAAGIDAASSAWVGERPRGQPGPELVGLPPDARYHGGFSASMQAHLATIAAIERRSCAAHPAHPGGAHAVYVYTVDRPLEHVRDHVVAELNRLGVADAGEADGTSGTIRTARLSLGDPAELARLSESTGIAWPPGFLERYHAAFPRLRDAVGSIVEFEIAPEGPAHDGPWGADLPCVRIRLSRPYLDVEALQIHDRTAVQYIVSERLNGG